MPKIECENIPEQNLLAQGVIEVVKRRVSNAGFITLNKLISKLDYFSMLLFSAGLHDFETIKREYSSVFRFLIDCLPMSIVYGNPKIRINACDIFTWIIKEI